MIGSCLRRYPWAFMVLLLILAGCGVCHASGEDGREAVLLGPKLSGLYDDSAIISISERDSYHIGFGTLDLETSYWRIHFYPTPDEDLSLNGDRPMDLYTVQIHREGRVIDTKRGNSTAIDPTTDPLSVLFMHMSSLLSANDKPQHLWTDEEKLDLNLFSLFPHMGAMYVTYGLPPLARSGFFALRIPKALSCAKYASMPPREASWNTPPWQRESSPSGGKKSWYCAKQEEGKPMQILVDADACPVKSIIVALAKEQGIPVTMFIDTSHELRDGYSTIITVDKARDSADFALMKRLMPGDIVVTQDYGLAAMVLGKLAMALNQNGLVFTDRNIDGLLMDRHIGQKVRRSGGRTRGPSKRTPADDARFEEALRGLLAKK